MNPTQTMIKPFMYSSSEDLLCGYVHFNAKTKWCTATDRVQLVTWYAGDVVESLEDILIPLDAFPTRGHKVFISCGDNGWISSRDLDTGSITNHPPVFSPQAYPKSQHLVFNKGGDLKVGCHPTEEIAMNPAFLANVYKWTKHDTIKIALQGTYEGARITHGGTDPVEWVIIIMPVRIAL